MDTKKDKHRPGQNAVHFHIIRKNIKKWPLQRRPVLDHGIWYHSSLKGWHGKQDAVIKNQRNNNSEKNEQKHEMT